MCIEAQSRALAAWIRSNGVHTSGVNPSRREPITTAASASSREPWSLSLGPGDGPSRKPPQLPVSARSADRAAACAGGSSVRADAADMANSARSATIRVMSLSCKGERGAGRGRELTFRRPVITHRPCPPSLRREKGTTSAQRLTWTGARPETSEQIPCLTRLTLLLSAVGPPFSSSIRLYPGRVSRRSVSSGKRRAASWCLVATERIRTREARAARSPPSRAMGGPRQPLPGDAGSASVGCVVACHCSRPRPPSGCLRVLLRIRLRCERRIIEFYQGFVRVADNLRRHIGHSLASSMSREQYDFRFGKSPEGFCHYWGGVFRIEVTGHG